MNFSLPGAAHKSKSKGGGKRRKKKEMEFRKALDPSNNVMKKVLFFFFPPGCCKTCSLTAFRAFRGQWQPGGRTGRQKAEGANLWANGSHQAALRGHRMPTESRLGAGPRQRRPLAGTAEARRHWVSIGTACAACAASNELRSSTKSDYLHAAGRVLCYKI